jgi:hypothetical protein
MADTPQAAPNPVNLPASPQNGTGASGSKTNWLKDLLFPLVLAVVGIIIGFTSDVLKHEYELRSTTPRLRIAATVRQELAPPGKYRQRISTTVHPVGRPIIPTLVIVANAVNSRVRITSAHPRFEPANQEPEHREVDLGGSPEFMRGLGLANFHEPQRVIWDIDAETAEPMSGDLVRFDYRGVNVLEDENNVTWKERFSMVYLDLILIIYSVVATALAVYFHVKRR